MADNETKSDAKDEGDRPGLPDADDSPKSGASLPPAMAHRDSHTPMTKAE